MYRARMGTRRLADLATYETGRVGSPLNSSLNPILLAGAARYFVVSPTRRSWPADRSLPNPAGLFSSCEPFARVAADCRDW
jgi:hypothetical protein